MGSVLASALIGAVIGLAVGLWMGKDYHRLSPGDHAPLYVAMGLAMYGAFAGVAILGVAAVILIAVRLRKRSAARAA
jgi:hypothetical protein